jgi:serine/threonine protein kinase
MQNYQPMNPREEALCALALEQPAEKRTAFLDVMCEGDPALRQRLDALLAAHQQPGTLLATQAEAARPTIKLDLADALDEAVGQTLGRYKLLERVGEGGCGVVYVAEQTEPVRRRVALKIIKLGMDTKQVVARFEAERQALAMMDHPNIAKVLDAGTTGPSEPGSSGRESAHSSPSESQSRLTSAPTIGVGRPYFVMELVRGIKITDYCDQANLTTKDRLDLFIKVCQAIQHAHQKGIIHRDIKPSNIRVTLHDGVPVPKVIDFGIAKATDGRLTDNTIYTQLHQFIGTPAYMSPEQAEMSGLDIDTRSDIYSLGVLLYELLTGKTPFDAKELMSGGIDAMRKTIREKEPVRPSTRLSQTLPAANVSSLKSSSAGKPTTEEEVRASSRRLLRVKETITQLKGDLDWIVMKCLEKDRQRRYDTANGLAADLKRHLTNEPVLARPPSFGYRFQKAWRRNRLLYSAAGAVVATLIAGMSVSLLQANRAMRAKSQALESQRAEQDARFTAERERKNAVRAQQSAEEEKVRADHEAEHARQNAYVSDMNLASQAWETGNLLGARQLLSRHQPQLGQADLRGFEWRLLWGLAHEDKTKFRFHAGSNSVASVAISPDGLWLAWCGKDGRVRIVDVEARSEKFVLPGHSPQITSLAFSADGHWLASGGNDGLITIWDVPLWTLEGSLKGHIGNVNTLSFHPDGTRLVSTAADATVRIWNLTSLAQERDFQSPEKSPRLSVSPDGKTLATASYNSTLRLWNAALGEEVATLRGHSSVVQCLTWSADGRAILTGSGDATVRIWRAPSWEEITAAEAKDPPAASYGGQGKAESKQP